MRAADLDILFVPGLGGSGPDHWQSRWEEKLSTAKRVEQDDWSRLAVEPWRQRLVQRVAKARRPVVLVAHSAGVAAVAHAAAHFPPGVVRGAFLVAPPSRRAMQELAACEADFADVPDAPLPFPALLVASQTDPYSSFTEAEAFAAAWGAELADAGDSGHINADSGHGPWPEGLMRFAGFLKQLG
ncbi:MAG: serine hydrolase family protein [Cryobacterium sp.]|uniref:RBBP9/YdeN family alpha/beta hydrolase n=1 Tax=unclassified Chelatococcus TaxID=2638111 RepID=UPI001BD04980|nr:MULTISPECIES: alpha/beta hydrolase [unclassified Chelatococcus]MBS7698058.1 serine hydrolase family protein [Chelatococcus sp. YT9]MBX3088417.1 serine hydrolase family protein [Cryobacterium sp.]MBX3556624.1 serine hydrolase family protein [Chelatococcus sp.]